MKKYILFFLFFSTISFPQEISQNILSLENQIMTAARQTAGSSEKNSFSIFNEQPSMKKKNTGLAIIYSLLLPGMGELYADSYSSGKYFTIAEGALWITYFGINMYGNWQKDRYKSFAASNGVVTEGKDEDYFAIISEYNSIDDFNNEQALNREFTEMLDPENYHWSWDSNIERRTYRNMWVSSEQAYNNLRFVVGALILNRVISAINAVRITARHNKRVQESLSWNVSVGLVRQMNLPAGIGVNFQTSF